MTTRPFIKMHGLGNDFVVVDATEAPFPITSEAVRALADRRTGIGFDQLIVIEPPTENIAAAFMRIFNADGGEVDACGNATRCVARLLFARHQTDKAIIETATGLLNAWWANHDAGPVADTSPVDVAVDMGPAMTDWSEIPVAVECDTAHLPLSMGGLSDPVGVSMGNPHAVFFVDAVAAVPIMELGPMLEHDPLFPERANIGVAEVRDRRTIRLRVWERGVGLTRACGTGACAAAVAANRRGLTDREVTVVVDGGTLDIVWRDDGHVIMTGPAAIAFHGSFDTASWLMSATTSPAAA